jgi:hypothetical protein
VISVDTKKKELLGVFKNPGRQWRRSGAPTEVNTHDFPGDSVGKAVPYGIYDITTNTGWVNVGTDHDTAAFAVESIRRWWHAASRDYPAASRLLITADAGGSNGYRSRAWKTELAALAAETGLAITVCHLPPGTSKWNKIEHRLFCHITMNWRGRPLTSHEVIVQSIAATTTGTGLNVHAQLDTGDYPTGAQISDAQMAALPITRHGFHGDWNYTLHPATPDDTATTETLSPAPENLSHPTLHEHRRTDRTDQRPANHPRRTMRSHESRSPPSDRSQQRQRNPPPSRSQIRAATHARVAGPAASHHPEPKTVATTRNPGSSVQQQQIHHPPSHPQHPTTPRSTRHHHHPRTDPTTHLDHETRPKPPIKIKSACYLSASP